MMLTQLREIFRYREAIRNLAVRDLRVRYSNAALGIVWSLLNPLALTLVFTLIFTVMMPNGIAKYPVFFLSALLPWNFFCLSFAMMTIGIISNPHLISRVYFPREVLPIAVVLTNATSFLIALVPLTVLMLFFGTPITWQLLWFPVLLAIQIVFSVGVGLIISSVNVYLRDTQQIVEVLTLPWFFMTPVIYPVTQIANETIRTAYLLINPMANLVTSYRQVIYYGLAPDPLLLGLTALEALIIFIAGLLIFRRLSPNFADEL